MAKEALYIPEEDLEIVIEIIQNGLQYTKGVPDDVVESLAQWCGDMSEYVESFREGE